MELDKTIRLLKNVCNYLSYNCNAPCLEVEVLEHLDELEQERAKQIELAPNSVITIKSE